MQTRQLGQSPLHVSRLCLGGNVFGWTADERTSFAVLDAFFDAGGNFIDTADVYSSWVPGHKGGESETIVGNWLKRTGKRAQVVVATKVGFQKGLAGDYIRRAAEDSLRRLQTDYIDLYYAHRDDRETTVAETLEAFAALVKEGKVRTIGASNFGAERLGEALEASRDKGWPRYECLQPEYNLYTRAPYETELEPLCEKSGLGVTPYSALASGFLTGKYRSESDLAERARGGKVKNYLNERGQRILQALDEVAKEHGATPGSVALAWLMARASVTAPIASATSREQLTELVSAAELKLDRESLEKLNTASAETTATAHA